MTTRSTIILVCACGHRGHIEISENDQPYSKPWVSATLVDLDARGSYAENYKIFSEERPSCPKCGASLTPDNISK